MQDFVRFSVKSALPVMFRSGTLLKGAAGDHFPCLKREYRTVISRPASAFVENQMASKPPSSVQVTAG